MRQSPLRVREMALIALFASLLTASAFFRIPMPPVPMTLQAQVALLSGVLLGSRGGFFSTALYLLLGLLGLPVFAGGGGIGYILQPTFGYLIGFCLGSFLCGKIAEVGAPTVCRLLSAQFVGLAVIYLFGVLWYFVTAELLYDLQLGLRRILFGGLLLTLPADVALSAAGAFAARYLLPRLKQLRP